MGLETGAIVLATIAGGATLGKMGFEAKAASEKEDALKLQGEEQTLQYQQKTLSNYDVLSKTLDAQEAQMTTRGVAFSSPSFNAIQRETVNIGSKKQANLNIEDDIAQQNLENEKKNVRTTLFAQLFGDVASTSLAATNIAEKLPSKLPQMEA